MTCAPQGSLVRCSDDGHPGSARHARVSSDAVVVVVGAAAAVVGRGAAVVLGAVVAVVDARLVVGLDRAGAVAVVVVTSAAAIVVDDPCDHPHAGTAARATITPITRSVLMCIRTQRPP